MQLPIPQDWDNETWRCVQIEWPDSDLWVGFLHGVLSQFMRGRLWDEKTGTIVDAQSVGREIWYRNTPLVSCGGEKPTNGSGESSTGINVGFYSFCELLEKVECQMSMCGPCPPIRFSNGVLQYFFCGEWIDIGVVSEQVVQQPYPGGYTEEPPGEYDACGKADAMVEAIYTIAQAAWDNKDGPTYFLNIGAVDSALPGFNLNNQNILQVLSGARALDDIYTEGELLSESQAQRWKCAIAPLLGTDTPGITAGELDAFRSALYQVWTDVNVVAWYNNIIQAFGYGDMNTIAASGAENTGADCTCPSLNQYPGYTVVQMTWDFTYFSPNTTEQHDTPLTGGTPLPQNWIAAHYQWEGLNSPNGEIKVFDQAFQIISNYSTGAGEFGLYDNADAKGQAFLNTFFPTAPTSVATDLTEYQDSILTVQTSGNNVQVTTTGTLTLVYYTP